MKKLLGLVAPVLLVAGIACIGVGVTGSPEHRVANPDNPLLGPWRPNCVDATIDDADIAFEPESECSTSWGRVCEPVTYRVDGNDVVVIDATGEERQYRVEDDRAYTVVDGDVQDSCWLE